MSMTDMTVSFLFIVILLLAFFASQYNSEDVVARSSYEFVMSERDAARQERDAALAELRVIIAERDAAGQERDEAIAELKVTIAERDAAQRERDSAIAELKMVVVERDELRLKLQTTMAKHDAALRVIELLRQRLEQLAETVKRRDQEIVALDRRVQDLSAEIERLRLQIAKLEARLKQDNPLEKYGAQAADVRRRMLERLSKAVQSDIEQQRIEGLTVTAQGDALRFQGSGLFASGARSLTGRSLEIVRLLGKHLERELPCYSVGARSLITKACNPDLVLFETIQVEGHTDSAGANAFNLDLSAGRALSAFTAIAPDRSGEGSEMLAYENLLGQPLLAFAGYGEMRPIVDEATGDRSANRRIDLRFIMYVPPGIEFIPETVEDLDDLGERLRRRAAAR